MSGEIRVLAAVANQSAREALTNMLSELGYAAAPAGASAEVLEILQSAGSPDILMIDDSMPGINPAELKNAVTPGGAGTSPYIIALADSGRLDGAEKWINSGADDYAEKPLHPLALKIRLTAAARFLKLREEALAMKKKLASESTKDSLTGVLNRKTLMEELRKAMERSRRESKPMSIALFEIDEFKIIVEAHGILAGEGALRGVAKFLSRTLRTYDVVGRLGGHEFLLILPDCAADIAFKILERIQLSIRNEIFAASGNAIKLTLSGGVSQLNAGMEEPSDLIKIAQRELEKSRE